MLGLGRFCQESLVHMTRKYFAECMRGFGLFRILRKMRAKGFGSYDASCETTSLFDRSECLEWSELFGIEI
jgi:hypothetical protein